MKKLHNIFDNLLKGRQGEIEVLEKLTMLLRMPEGEENFFIIPSFKVPSITGPTEIDLVLLHPTFGIFVIEVKNWNSLQSITSVNSPFERANEYKNLLLSHLQAKFKQVPINVEYRVIFPRLTREDGKAFFAENKNLDAYSDITFFGDDLLAKHALQTFFRAKTAQVPNKKEFIKIAELFLDKEKIKSAEGRIMPVITKDEILFFDYKQLSILEGYSEGFRIIRGVAGTGKTIIMTNFIANRLNQDPSEKFLVLAFNTKLTESIRQSLDHPSAQKNVAVISLMQLLERVGFDWGALGGKPSDFKQMMDALKSTKATEEFRVKLQARLQVKPIDYFLCDEAQDMPANLMRVIYDEIGDCIFFIDEAQRFFAHSMSTISEVFHHPEFEKLSMRGRVKNLKNVYRTPSNIAKTAFALLAHDTQLNDYYRKSFYLKGSFLDDIQFVLQDGHIALGDWSKYSDVVNLIKDLPDQDDVVVLTPFKKSVEGISKSLSDAGLDQSVQVMTYQSIKGLEGKTIILHNFVGYLENVVKNEPDMLYRKAYVVMTRALENLYISIPDDYKTDNPSIQKVLDQVRQDALTFEDVQREAFIEANQPVAKEEGVIKKFNHRLAKLKPSFKEANETTQFVAAASQLFAVVAGVFGGLSGM